MELHTVTAEFLKKVKDGAWALSKKDGLKLAVAQDAVARNNGFRDYRHLASCEEKPVQRFSRLLAKQGILQPEDSHVATFYWVLADQEYEALITRYQMPMGPEHELPGGLKTFEVLGLASDYIEATKSTVFPDEDRYRILSELYKEGFRIEKHSDNVRTAISHVISYTDTNSFMSERQALKIDFGSLRPVEHNQITRLREQVGFALGAFLLSVSRQCAHEATYHPRFVDFMSHYVATLPDDCDNDVRAILVTRYPAPRKLNMKPDGPLRRWRSQKEKPSLSGL